MSLNAVTVWAADRTPGPEPEATGPDPVFEALAEALARAKEHRPASNLWMLLETLVEFRDEPAALAELAHAAMLIEPRGAGR